MQEFHSREQNHDLRFGVFAAVLPFPGCPLPVAVWPFFDSQVTNLSIQVEFLQAIYLDHLVLKDLWSWCADRRGKKNALRPPEPSMNNTDPSKVLGLSLLLLAMLLSGPALAQTDPSGEWENRFHEDEPERVPGPEIGDYLGLPINDAARLRGDSWVATLLELPENQCRPHLSLPKTLSAATWAVKRARRLRFLVDARGTSPRTDRSLVSPAKG